MKRSYIITALVLLLLIGSVLFYKSRQTGPSLSQQTKSSTDLTYTDATKTTVTLRKRPTRIVCITGICEDILFELGIKPVAISDTVDEQPEFYGDAGKSIPQIGGSFFQPSLEDIAKAKPDIVIGLAGVHDKIRSALKPIAPLYIMDLSNYNDSITYLLSIGKLTGKTKEAEAARDRFLHKLAAYEAKSPKNISAGLLSGSDVNFAMDTNAALYGGVLAKVTAWPWPAPGNLQTGAEQDNTIPYSLEKVLSVNPDVLFVLSDGKTPESQLLSENPLWSQLKAVKNNQVYEVRPPIWEYARGTKSLGIMLDEAMQKLYPTVFPHPLQ